MPRTELELEDLLIGEENGENGGSCRRVGVLFCYSLGKVSSVCDSSGGTGVRGAG